MANVLKAEKQVAVISALVEGASVRSVERMTGVHRDTILRLMVRVSQAATRFSDATLRGLNCQRIEVDEIWAYVAKKQRNVGPTDDRSRIGDLLDGRRRRDHGRHPGAVHHPVRGGRPDHPGCRLCCDEGDADAAPPGMDLIPEAIRGTDRQTGWSGCALPDRACAGGRERIPGPTPPGPPHRAPRLRRTSPLGADWPWRCPCRYGYRPGHAPLRRRCLHRPPLPRESGRRVPAAGRAAPTPCSPPTGRRGSAVTG